MSTKQKVGIILLSALVLAGGTYLVIKKLGKTQKSGVSITFSKNKKG